MIRVLVSGSGKMGQAIVEAIAREEDLEAVSIVDKLAPGDASASGLPLFNDAVAAIEATSPDVVIDFTNAAWTPELTAAAVPRGVRPVIGTSGLSDAYVAGLAEDCAKQKLGGVVAANFAIGAVLMMYAARVAARFFESVEIIEMHHDKKVDAPSGTAIATAQGMLGARGGQPFERNEPEQQTIEGSRRASVDGVSVHSVRLPGLVAHQEVIFGGLGQTLTIRHDSTGRDSFMPGIILATREVMKRDGLVVGLDALIGLS